MADEPVQEKAVVPYPTATTSIVNVPMPSKEPGQRGINITDLFITRWTPPWARPPSLPAYTWRAWVLNQPVAVACRETLISLLTGLDWNISARDADKKDDLSASIRYYSKLLAHGGYYLGTDFSGFLEWVVGDLLDIPFGGAVEVGRRGDDPKGRVVWLHPLDGGTLYPTLNLDFPVVQYYQGYTAVAFPAHSIARLMMTPRPEIFREGWGIAPPEKIYFALDMLNRGDKYYANLLLDVPPAGILDLGDMEESSAKTWVESFRNFVANTTDAFRIPVLYEHNNEVKFLPFGKVPNDIMFDHITLRYSAIVCAAYGISLNDIGLQTTSRGGETLAGSIRATAQTRRTGIARLKAKVKGFIETILPDELTFDWVDYDDEHNVAMGRARLASATAFNLAAQAGSISPEEFRMQMLKDGLMDIPVGLTPPPDAQPMQPASPFGGGGKTGTKPGKPTHPGALGHGVPPSVGGEGELNARAFVRKNKTFDVNLNNFVTKMVNVLRPVILGHIYSFNDEEILTAHSAISDTVFEIDGLAEILKELSVGKPILSLNQGIITAEPDFQSSNMYKDPAKRKDFENRLKEKLRLGINGLMANLVTQSLTDVMTETATQEILSASFDQMAVEGSVDSDYNYIVSEVKDRVAQNVDAVLHNYLLDMIHMENQDGKEG